MNKQLVLHWERIQERRLCIFIKIITNKSYPSNKCPLHCDHNKNIRIDNREKQY